MSYVIYNKDTTLILRARARSVGCWVEYYKSEAAAKAALTRLDKKGKLHKDTVKSDYAIADTNDFYSMIEKEETVRSLMNGAKVTQGVNTPLSCDPSSETYWSM